MPSPKTPDVPSTPDFGKPDVNRRRALVKLGLAVGAAYIAPTVLSIDRSARAMGPSCAVNPTKC
ncbi:MAG: hypothetical protein HQ481_06595 [Alphaproteobacteria bacterium]|nr:hypothetical protein [Alphaproteobacteria bacterium]